MIMITNIALTHDRAIPGTAIGTLKAFDENRAPVDCDWQLAGDAVQFITLRPDPTTLIVKRPLPTGEYPLSVVAIGKDPTVGFADDAEFTVSILPVPVAITPVPPPGVPHKTLPDGGFAFRENGYHFEWHPPEPGTTHRAWSLKITLPAEDAA